MDHDLGGGANLYRESKVKTLLEKEQAVLLLTYNFYIDQFALIYYHKNRRIHFDLGSFQEFGVLFDWVRFDEIFINDLVSFPNPLGVIKTIFQWKQRHPFAIRLAVHNYFSICPSYNLLNHKNEFCHSFDTNSCKITFPNNHGEFRMYCRSNENFDIDEWRTIWRDLLQMADEILCFSKCSADILCKVYNDVNGKLNIVPHRVDYLCTVKRRPKQTGEDLVIGVLGAINHAKGITIIQEMAELIILKKINVKIIIIGKTSVKIKSPIIKVTGEYNREQLPELVLKFDVDIFLIPSIWPETFSYTAEEVIQMNYPLAVFNIGAPAERVATYNYGLIIKEIDADSALDQISNWKNDSRSNG